MKTPRRIQAPIIIEDGQQIPEASKIIQADAQGNVVADPAEQNRIEALFKDAIDVTPFPDGSIYKMGPNPDGTPTWVIFNSKQVILALVRFPQIAELICHACFLYFMNVRARQAAEESAKKDAPPTPEADEKAQG